MRIINATIGSNRVYAGSVSIGEEPVVALMNDAEHLDNIQDLIEAETAAVFWADGGMKTDHNGEDVLGAGVAWREKSGELEEGEVDEGVVEWKAESFELGRDTGSVHDSELFAIASALRLAMERMRKRPEPMLKFVQILSDSQTVLRGLGGNTIEHLGPAVSAPWALQQVYDFTDALVSGGVAVELVWVKGHALSDGNQRADAAAREGWRRQMGVVGERRWGRRCEVPEQIATMGTDAIEEWYWRKNKVGLCNGREEGDDVQVEGRLAAAPSLLSSEPVPLVGDDDDDGSIDMDISDDDE
ncbi:hypothetical protein T440DRAFT_469512 [Plenodomus tracheiphilus IPT5]|uniref:RNase H type-1 domain-containing protein n=1 Tax=Plenodomus tracheiphilus IPT5 TaxID=1408161 RepID=A0A6A7B3S6_9PLEO|nr:hypothetical protein T440DRAFT_469512 [Plenodomus tracheiphilus IPT5]